MENSEFEYFDSTDVTVDPMHVVNAVLVPRMENLLAKMQEETNLCDEYGSGVVAEFLFKGNKLEVEFQLRKLIDYRKATPYVEADRPLLIQQAQRFVDHIKLASENPIRKRMRDLNIQLWQSYRSDIQVDLDNAIRQLKFNHTSKHAKKECICFCNSPLLG
jgi:hypothetical protein